VVKRRAGAAVEDEVMVLGVLRPSLLPEAAVPDQLLKVARPVGAHGAEGYLEERQPFRPKLGEVYDRRERPPSRGRASVNLSREVI